MNQALKNPQVVQQKSITTAPHPRRGEVRLIDQAVRLSRTPANVHSVLEDKGASNVDVLRELGYDADGIASGLTAMQGRKCALLSAASAIKTEKKTKRVFSRERQKRQWNSKSR